MLILCFGYDSLTVLRISVVFRDVAAHPQYFLARCIFLQDVYLQTDKARKALLYLFAGSSLSMQKFACCPRKLCTPD